ncbi:LysR family transcriptional regulator [Spongiactinospora rosea]|uniref:LysR family transcriptional regulator n=1 Tax=Spongiactinospora rosea TaxID=2248750 RepID=A0A366LQL6_9ACTN|nr:LysR family transcriptional regulator [Spongiactinospora rosea]RBQ16191.1 LysR family transcriptional regulator [Spongiactinospora rosea]
MRQVHVQQIECLLVLAEELHFGRTAERLGYSQSRVSQLIAAIERRVGVRLVDRTSRRVTLTRFGAQFVAEVRPAYESLTTAFAQARDRAQRGALRRLRIGFHGSLYEEITESFRRLRADQDVTIALTEIPLGSPFSGVLDGLLDAAIIELPVREPALTVGFRFPPQDHLLAVAASHPLATRTRVHAEDLATLDVLRPSGDAPTYWLDARVPRTTPSGAPIPSSTHITTVQEGLALVATGDHTMLVCHPLATRTTRTDVHYLPIDGLPEPSQLALIWPTTHTTPQLTTLAHLLHEQFADSRSIRTHK